MRYGASQFTRVKCEGSYEAVVQKARDRGIQIDPASFAREGPIRSTWRRMRAGRPLAAPRERGDKKDD